MTGKIWTAEESRELISVVKANLPLYAKGGKNYKDTEQKNLAWQAIGAVLNPQCSGEEARKKFKSLRDTFNKELRKMKQKKPSGAAGGEAFSKSNWEFFGDLDLLTPHITTRKTFSNIPDTNSPSFSLESGISTPPSLPSNLSSTLLLSVPSVVDSPTASPLMSPTDSVWLNEMDDCFASDASLISNSTAISASATPGMSGSTTGSASPDLSATSTSIRGN